MRVVGLVVPLGGLKRYPGGRHEVAQVPVFSQLGGVAGVAVRLAAAIELGVVLFKDRVIKELRWGGAEVQGLGLRA